mgnify:CR=1 FL=1
MAQEALDRIAELYAIEERIRGRTADEPCAGGFARAGARVVHGDQTFRYTRPLRPGDRLVTVVEIAAARAAAGNDILTLACSSSTEEGEHVVTSTLTLVGRGTAE